MSEMPSLSREWQEIVSRYRLNDFEHVWDLSLERVDRPNQKGLGWSEVCLMSVVTDENIEKIVYVKRQQNYGTRLWPAIWKTQPTFRSEYNNMLRLKALSVPVVMPLVYMESEDKGVNRTILVTIGLDEYAALSDIERELADFNYRKELVMAVSKALANLHSKGLQHGCLYSKHIYVRRTGNDYDVRFIDLEKVAGFAWFNNSAFRDLDSLNRHAENWRTVDRARFLKHYCAATGEDWRFLFARLSKSYITWIGH